MSDDAIHEKMMAVQGNVTAFAERQGYDPCPAIKIGQELLVPAWEAIADLQRQLEEAQKEVIKFMDVANRNAQERENAVEQWGTEVEALQAQLAAMLGTLQAHEFHAGYCVAGCSSYPTGKHADKCWLGKVLANSSTAADQWLRERDAKTFQQLMSILICRHEHARGGNDYISCDDCGFEWDYRKPTSASGTNLAELLARKREGE